MDERDAVFELASTDQCAGVAPAIVGGLTHWRLRRGSTWLDILRPTTRSALKDCDPLAMASFPMVPYANRIRDGRFTFDGRAIVLPLNFGDHPHSIHGHGWQAPWDVIERTPARIKLIYRHSADAWSFDYDARQTIALTQFGLSIALSVTNVACRPMPVGLGVHTYFARPSRARLTARLDGVWLTDDEVMPTTHAILPPHWNMATGSAVGEMACDNVFTGWDGSAIVEWPADRLRIHIEAGEPFRYLVVYTPAHEDFFCVEPVSQLTDAFNLAAAGAEDTGMRVLEPGEELSGTVRFLVETV